MTDLGLSDAERKLMEGVFSAMPQITGVSVFGSRAKGVASPSSDIDLAVEGIDDPLQAESLAGELDELPLPYRFDVKALAAIQSASLRDHIERVGVRIYSRDRQEELS
jgi:predicted nucleotidyltransferase